MSRREDVDNLFWHDADVDALSNDAVLLYLWGFTNPRCGMAGLYKVARRQLLEGRLPEDRLSAAIDELERGRFAFYEGDVLWIRTRVKHLRTRTKQMAKSILSDLEKIDPEHPLLAAFAAEYSDSWLSRAIEKHSLDDAVLPRFDRGSGEVLGQGHGPGKGTGRALNRENVWSNGDGEEIAA